MKKFILQYTSFCEICVLILHFYTIFYTTRGCGTPTIIYIHIIKLKKSIYIAAFRTVDDFKAKKCQNCLGWMGFNRKRHSKSSLFLFLSRGYQIRSFALGNKNGFFNLEKIFFVRRKQLISLIRISDHLLERKRAEF